MSETMMAYRCPSCSEAVFGSVDVFSRGDGRIKLKCACGESMLEGEISGDKIKLSVPCIFCPEKHTYSLLKSAVLSGSFFELPCPVTGLPALFVGDANTVSGAVEENEKEIRRIADEAGIDLDSDRITVDRESIKEQLLKLLANLKVEGRIICDCENKEDSDLAITVSPEGVEVKCKKCGASRSFRAMTTLDCEYISEIDLLYLE